MSVDLLRERSEISQGKNHSPAFKAKVDLEALKGEQTFAELSSKLGIHPTMIHSWKRALLEGSPGVSECGGKTAPETDQEQVKELHANADLSIGEQCKPLLISWSSFYDHPKGTMALNLMLMRQVD